MAKTRNRLSAEEVSSQIGAHHNLDLLKELHLLTPDGQLNADSLRKLKQVDHLLHFFEPIFKSGAAPQSVVDLGAGKSYLGFLLYDRFLKKGGSLHAVELRDALVNASKASASRLGYSGIHFHPQSIADFIQDDKITPDLVVAMHACDTATDDALDYGISKNSKWIAVIPCCQASVARALQENKGQYSEVDASLFRHPIHRREFGSHLTNVLRCLRLEAAGYHLTVTELVGFEHSFKNELILAEKKGSSRPEAVARLEAMLKKYPLGDLSERFYFR
jgi:hypothetical protein